jgi:DNA-directed RNA polymerase alpha subunit
MSKKEIGQMAGVCAERVRQVICKALRKLRSLPNLRLIFGDLGTARLMEDYRARIHKERELLDEYRDIIKDKAMSLDIDTVTIDEMKVLGISIADIPGISVRTYNCLARSGNYYLSTLVRNIAENPDYLRSVSNLGEKSAQEIEGYLDFYLGNKD